LAAFIIAYLVLATLFSGVLSAAQALVSRQGFGSLLFEGNQGFVLRALVLMLIPAVLLGWACNYVLEDLPTRALGWTLHRGWLRDALIGAALGSLSLAVAALIGAAGGGFRFNFDAAAGWTAVLHTLVSAALVFAAGAAAEEALFRGYPLQTMLRSLPAWLALIPSTLLFASGHLLNPNTVRGFTFFNTALAGVWLAVAYLRTRSLWFPLGLHWGWNWTMGALLGLPVSGITSFAPAPLLRAADAGPAWLTGGSYGLEGGVACTAALLLSTILIRRTRLVSATEELKRMTDGENPDPPVTMLKADQR
jgi:membrane protease YdiL (CAAX protease family)